MQEFSEHPGVCNDVSVFKVPPEPRSGSSFVPCASLFFNALAACWEVGKAGRKTVREREREREKLGKLFCWNFSATVQLRCSVIIVIIAIFDRAFCSSSFSFIPRQFLVVIIETNLAWRLGASVRSNEKFIAMSFRSDFLQKSLTRREKRSSLSVNALAIVLDWVYRASFLYNFLDLQIFYTCFIAWYFVFVSFIVVSHRVYHVSRATVPWNLLLLHFLYAFLLYFVFVSFIVKTAFTSIWELLVSDYIFFYRDLNTYLPLQNLYDT